jgi:hypothetical protein
VICRTSTSQGFVLLAQHYKHKKTPCHLFAAWLRVDSTLLAMNSVVEQRICQPRKQQLT